MRNPTPLTSSPSAVSRSRAVHGGRRLPVLLCVAAVGCASWEPGMDREAESLGTRTGGLVSQNGLSTNGLSTNGLSTNGLSTNGLSTNGFNTWFGQDPAKSDEVMRYVARCALAAGQTLTYTYSGTTYSWTGVLGLAPGWAGGAAATLAEQQVVSGCLAAHVNKYGVHLNISVLGRDALGTAIPTGSDELTTFNQPEAVFFGNLFNGEGLFVANDADYLAYDQSTVRACGLSAWAGDPDCAVVISHVGSARTYCQLDTARTHYTRCTYNGKAYRPITTRIRAQDIYRCGDGTCQLSEHCGTSTTAASCQADCGVCQ